LDQRKGNENLRVNPALFLDILSFEKGYDKALGGGKFIPQPYYNVLLQAQMEYNIWSFRAPKAEGLMQKVARVAQGKSQHEEIIGRTIELPIDRWINLVKQHETPIWYMEDPSDPLVRALPNNMLREFPSSMEALYRLMQVPIPDLQSFAGSRTHQDFVREAVEKSQREQHNVRSSFRDKFFN